jgi:collagenase-like PrtC family protease
MRPWGAVCVVLFAAVASADVTVMQSAELPIADRVVCSSNVVDRSNAVAVDAVAVAVPGLVEACFRDERPDYWSCQLSGIRPLRS